MPRRGNLATHTADRLREMILRGEYAVGQPLRELELCKVLGVSRIPVREALQRLEGEGLVSSRPNRGAVVSELSESEVREIVEACRLLESHVLRLAIPAVTAERLERARACLDELERTTDLREWSRANWRFHRTLYEAAGRPLIIELLTSLRDRAERAVAMSGADPRVRAQLNHEHRAILDQVAAGHADAAVALLDAHLENGRNQALRRLEPR